MDFIILILFSYGLYRLAVGYNITPWKWIARYVSVNLLAIMVMVGGILVVYGQNFTKDMQSNVKLSMAILPFELLFEVLLFIFFRGRMAKYVAALDKIDQPDNPTPPSPPQPPKKEDKDLSYFR